MFQADDIAQRLQSQSAEEEILELPRAVQGNGVKDDVIVDMGTVRMRRNNKGMLASGKAHRCLIADPVRFLRCDLTGLEGLPDLVSQDISLIDSAGDPQIFVLGKCEFLRRCLRTAGVGRNIFSGDCLIVQTVSGFFYMEVLWQRPN